MKVGLKKKLGFAAVATIAALSVGTSAFALKYAAVEHHLKADPALPDWTPGPVASVPEEEVRIVGADVMDEIVLGWAKIFRKAYPHLSVTLDLRASKAGADGLIKGTGDLAPVGREMLPAEHEAFVNKFGYEPFSVKVATGSVGSLGKTATSIILVDKDNPIKGLTLAELDAIYSTSDKRGHADIKTWGDLGLAGEWKDRPIHLYGLKAPNGIEAFFQATVMEGGPYKTNIQMVKGKGFTHAFNVAVQDMAKTPGGLTYAMLANVEPNVRVVPLAAKEGELYVMPTLENVYSHKYPLSRFVYIYVNRPPGKPLEPKVKEFLKAVLSKQGQEVVAEEGVYIPLTPEVVQEELKKLD